MQRKLTRNTSSSSKSIHSKLWFPSVDYQYNYVSTGRKKFRVFLRQHTVSAYVFSLRRLSVEATWDQSFSSIDGVWSRLEVLTSKTLWGLIRENIVNHYKVPCVKVQLKANRGKAVLMIAPQTVNFSLSSIYMAAYHWVAKNIQRGSFYKSPENTNRPLLLVALYTQTQRLLLN